MNEENKNTNGVEEVPAQKNIDAALKDFSRETGIRIELLRRFINRQTRQMINDPLGPLFPTIQDLLTECDKNAPRRIGPPYRRHAELVEMISDQKVLLDAFCILSAEKKKKACKLMSKEIHGEWKPSAFESLTEDENHLMGAYLALPEEAREEKVLQVVRLAQEEMKNIRRAQNSSGEL